MIGHALLRWKAAGPVLLLIFVFSVLLLLRDVGPLPSIAVDFDSGPQDQPEPVATTGSGPTPSPTSPPDPDRNKYFHEPGMSDLTRHYDSRYFKEVVTEEERQETLTHLIQSYFDTFQKLGVETWIAHGTLLGWYWNGKILPWDWDLDTQVSDHGLRTLAETHNGTTHRYPPSNGRPERRYLLDVNSWSWQREHGDGANIIDARYISMDTGLFVDITGLTELEPDTKPGIVMCKNNHEYKMEDIWPLRVSVFEDVRVKIPRHYEAILADEYSQEALVRTEFNGHVFDPKVKEWVRVDDNSTVHD
ncbi:hypothetical protein PV08_08820 [Exophiala spinifera]|uniref:LicD/FKTN/FKRP nucleotidyltransferase domain-containing protein n=1 Tax=Exophiala spinifera TaxID=91928 RepID=A0A0D2BR07_9EURO|nr:uncharacterized protein PV08_08820 [Exophiala spinifera]KIW13629.1 hypothetical protein PV08_08820 [Exophiala spinifera]